ncbi:MAG: hypothetical protein ACTS7I_03140 [Candidatus Hodgkinia cicadicola]
MSLANSEDAYGPKSHSTCNASASKAARAHSSRRDGQNDYAFSNGKLSLRERRQPVVNVWIVLEVSSLSLSIGQSMASY